MIAGLSSAGIATAIRTAGEARQRLDDAARQMATGKRVASVKDDGAAWARANTLQDEGATWTYRAEKMREYGATSSMIAEANAEATSLLQETQRLLAHAANSAPGSKERADYAREWDIMRGRARVLQTFVDRIVEHTGTASISIHTPPTEWSWKPDTVDPFLNSYVVPFSRTGTAITSGVNAPTYTPSVYAVDQDFTGASQALMVQAASEQLSSGSGLSRLNYIFMPWSGGAQRRADSMADHAAAQADRVEAAAASLTDADLGQVAAQRATAQTRQQLALQTVRAALDAYGAYAGGLLGNAQRSQRSILA